MEIEHFEAVLLRASHSDRIGHEVHVSAISAEVDAATTQLRLITTPKSLCFSLDSQSQSLVMVAWKKLTVCCVMVE